MFSFLIISSYPQTILKHVIKNYLHIYIIYINHTACKDCMQTDTFFTDMTWGFLNLTIFIISQQKVTHKAC